MAIPQIYLNNCSYLRKAEINLFEVVVLCLVTTLMTVNITYLVTTLNHLLLDLFLISVCV